MTEPTAIDPEDRARVLEHLRVSQRLIPAVVAGCIAGLIGAAVWAVIAIFTQHEIGWIAIGVGFLVGFAVRVAGRGFEVRYAAIGGALALAAVVAGKILALCGLIAKQENISFWDVLGNFPFSELPAVMRETFEPMDLLFYALAVWMGWKGARREIDEAEIRSTFDRLKAER
jgi:hypothetical protein